MYQPPNMDIWEGRNDPEEGKAGQRWHHIVRALDLSDSFMISDDDSNQKIALLGFCSDEGVTRNQGREGAKEGPIALRRALANLALHFDESQLRLFDAGNVVVSGNQLEKAQEMLGNKVQRLLKNNFLPILLGGGHEISYGHYRGIKEFMGHEKVGIVNVDAHFDLRNQPQATSGTPFLQIANELESEGQEFLYFVLGINQSQNTRAMFDTAKKLNVHYILDRDFGHERLDPCENELMRFIFGADRLYLTIDLDAFSSAYSPGVSAPSPLGLAPLPVMKWLEALINCRKLVSLDIAELNPRLDKDGRSAKLGAQLVYHIVQKIAEYQPASV